MVGDKPPHLLDGGVARLGDACGLRLCRGRADFRIEAAAEAVSRSAGMGPV